MPLPRSLTDRAHHARRIAGAVALAGARRLIRRSDQDDTAFGEALVAELDTMKGMAMKVGQILSYMDGAVPASTQVALAKLQRGAAAHPWESLVPEVERALNAPIATLFDRVDPTPVAAASIGQVHRAWLGGRALALKVQYPGVREMFEADVVQLRRIAGLAGLATRVDGQAIVDDLRARLVEECDYAHEAAWQERFRAAFADRPDVRIPDVLAERSATTVLTTQWADGLPLEALVRAEAAARRDAGVTLATFAWRGMFVHGAIHADPHPGNQIYVPGGVVFLDFGCVRVFDPSWVDAQRRLVRAVLDGDRASFRRAVGDVGLVAGPGFDFDAHWAQERWAWEPYLGGNYRFDRDYLQRGQRFSGPGNPNLRKIAIPPPWIWLTRLSFGLHAVLGRLGAEGRFDLLLRDILDQPAVRMVA